MKPDYKPPKITSQIAYSRFKVFTYKYTENYDTFTSSLNMFLSKHKILDINVSANEKIHVFIVKYI